MPVTVDTTRCVGCRLCELACSFSRHGQFNPSLAAIAVCFQDDGTLAVAISEDCAACRRPLCADFCPVGAITSGKDQASAARS
ncbi:MAG: 4Fe-4S binding protein [Deltaproteobacteria bacterium]|nr:4Fe-4S binding protein [Deltaproteobacteria bacterium]MBW2356761.1 4Fe-4S binding protein [Deltaproteobacteria bacterium]